jgi:hypothetical protein
MEQVSLEKALEILSSYGTYVTLEEAKLILEFLQELAEIAVTEYLKT